MLSQKKANERMEKYFEREQKKMMRKAKIGQFYAKITVNFWIKFYSRKGCSVIFMSNLSPNTIKKLEKNGYKVYFNIDRYDIEW